MDIDRLIVNGIDKRCIVRILSSLVVLDLIGMDEFVLAMAGMEGLDLEESDVSESFLSVICGSYGDDWL